jgi:hypothetical protein
MQRAGRVFDGANEIEVVARRVELAKVAQHLEQTEWQDDRAVRALLVDDGDSDISDVADAAHGDGSGVEAPVLRK